MTSTSIRYWDIKPEPKTALGCWKRWLNWTHARLLSGIGKKIEVRYE